MAYVYVLASLVKDVLSVGNGRKQNITFIVPSLLLFIQLKIYINSLYNITLFDR